MQETTRKVAAHYHTAQCMFHSHSHLVLFEVSPDPPSLVVGQSVPVLLEESVDAWNSPIPGVFQILQRQSPVLSKGLLSLESVLRPHTLRVDELTLPRLDVAVEVGDELVFLVAHSGSEMCDLSLGLLGPPAQEKVEWMECCDRLEDGSTLCHTVKHLSLPDLLSQLKQTTVSLS